MSATSSTSTTASSAGPSDSPPPSGIGTIAVLGITGLRGRLATYRDDQAVAEMVTLQHTLRGRIPDRVRRPESVTSVL